MFLVRKCLKIFARLFEFGIQNEELDSSCYVDIYWDKVETETMALKFCSCLPCFPFLFLARGSDKESFLCVPLNYIELGGPNPLH